MRLDIYLVENNIFKSRSRAQAEIKDSHISVNGMIITKSNYDLKGDETIDVINQMPYVSRGGLKLKGAIDTFKLNFKDKIVLDIGASTGGFTDCALKEGAKLVYAVDVGSDQLDLSLKNNKNVISMENTNILDTDIRDNIDIMVMDVSFVSIYHLLEAIKKYMNENNFLVCLIKPQFEAGKMVGKGIIKDKKTHLEILLNVNKYLNEAGLYINKIEPSPIKGGSGNIEFISIISYNNKSLINFKEVVEKAHRKE